jgi:pyridoxal phosphate enzyme (YggS family)
MKSRALEISENLASVEERIGRALQESNRRRDEIALIAVTKFFPLSDLEILYGLGLRNFGENRDQEGSAKANELPSDISWHFQGQIQSKKIPSIIEWARVIHSLDSLEHARKFNQRLKEMEQSREFFLQLNLEPDRTDRGGLPADQVEGFLNASREFSQVKIVGLMSVPPLDKSPAQAFAEVASIAHTLELSSLSLGMSNDFEDAIVAGATHIRVGSSILGSRPTPA